MAHWADKYVGMPAEGDHPCWLLVRRVWIEQIGFFMPRFDDCSEPWAEVTEQSKKFIPIPEAESREFDAVIMNGTSRHRFHIGVIASPGLVLHVHEEETARVDKLKSLHPKQILRGAWSSR